MYEHHTGSLATKSHTDCNYGHCLLSEPHVPDHDKSSGSVSYTHLDVYKRQTHRGGLLHEGIVPSHAAYYFVGFWAWDTWRFSAALAKFNPKLAKDNIRAMFDYQQPDGMIIDCIYTDPAENNARDKMCIRDRNCPQPCKLPEEQASMKTKIHSTPLLLQS